MRILKAMAWLAALAVMPTQAAAMPAYVCSVAEVFECTAVSGCKRVTRQSANLPPMVTLNTKEKNLFSGLFGGESLLENGDVYEDEKVVILRGRRKLQTWSAVVNKVTGDMSGTIAQLDRAFTQFGHCTPGKP